LSNAKWRAIKEKLALGIIFLDESHGPQRGNPFLSSGLHNPHCSMTDQNMQILSSDVFWGEISCGRATPLAVPNRELGPS
jgi:hypothetical protein